MKKDFDLIVIGSGLFSSVLATIMAKNKLSVLIIDKGKHPRFAIGESTIPVTTTMFKIISKKYDIPEILDLLNLTSVSNNSGVKLNFGFAYHNPKEKHHAKDITQSILPEPGFHYYREDIDNFMFNVSKKYGSIALENCEIKNIEITKENVYVETEDNGIFSSRFIIDGSGPARVLSRFIDLEDDSASLKHKSQTIFNHSINVKSFDSVVSYGNLLSKFHQGTLHHIFKDGWMWIIPFNNHDESKNNAISIGVNLENGFNDSENVEKIFNDFIKQYPSIEEQFRGYAVLRKWSMTPKRMQYKIRNITGSRFALLSHTGGFIDALFSKGMANSALLVEQIASSLLKAFSENKFTKEQFNVINDIQDRLISHDDRLVHYAYKSFKDYKLWKFWFKVWWVDAYLPFLELEKVLSNLNEYESKNIASVIPVYSSEYMEYYNSLCDRFDTLIKKEGIHDEDISKLDDLFYSSKFNQCILAFLSEDGKIISLKKTK